MNVTYKGKFHLDISIESYLFHGMTSIRLSRLFTRNGIGQYKMQTADCRLQTGYKMQTRYKMQTADCRLGIKCILRPKLDINCRLRATLSFRAIGDILSSLTHPCRVIALLSSFPRNFLSICIDCEQSMPTDRLFFCVET